MFIEHSVYFYERDIVHFYYLNLYEGYFRNICLEYMSGIHMYMTRTEYLKEIHTFNFLGTLMSRSFVEVFGRIYMYMSIIPV